MKVDFDQVITDLDGKAQLDEESKGSPKLTLGAACLKAIRTPLQEDQGLVGETAFKRLELARTIKKGGEQEIDPEDAVLIRNRAAKVWIIDIAGVVYEKLK